MALDLNQMAQSFYSMFQQLNQTAVEMVGLDVKWCRSVPYENSEDVILQEYTLLNVECPKDILIVTSKTDYNPGALQVDFFGINYEAPLEISITKTTWQNVYGIGSQPQKADIVYIPLLNKLYEVATATVDYGFAEQPTGFKCQLVKYNPQASRRESDSMMESIQDITVSQERLFGEELSKQIADITDPEQFDAEISTSREPYKVYDKSSIIMDDLIVNGNICARSHYNFRKGDYTVSYPAVTDNDSSHNWRLFTCWFRINSDKSKVYNVDIQELYNKTKFVWQLKIKCNNMLEIGDYVTLQRGSTIKLSGTITDKHNDLYMLDIPVSSALNASKRVTNWYSVKGYTLSTGITYNILSSDSLEVSIKNNRICVGKTEYGYSVQSGQWYFLSLQMNSKTEEIRLFTIDENDKLTQVFTDSKNINRNSFENGNFSIHNEKLDFDLTNIRYYMTTRKTSIEHIRQDAQSRFSKSNSLALLLDNAEIVNDEQYIGISK